MKTKQLKKIGLLGGMSWESTLGYYSLLNNGVKESLGGLHSARVVLNSVDFDEIEKLQHLGKWNKLAKILAKEAKCIEDAGAEFLLICTNTMHKVAPEIQKKINIPILHIADATAKELIKNNIKNVGLLGTAFTMQEDFYKGRLTDKFDLNVLVPKEKDIKIIHDIIYNELCLGKISKNSKKKYLKIIDKLVKNGAQGIILGCTEIGMLIKQTDTNIKLFDTTVIHVKEAVNTSIN